MTNPDIIILSRESYRIPAPKSFTIGDPEILKQVWSEAATTAEKKMVFERDRIPKSWRASMVFTKELWEHRYPVMAARICVSHKDYADTYESGQYFVDAVKRGYPRDLVCEKAAYRIMVEHHTPDEHGNVVSDYQFSTGADGTYGIATDMIRRYGFSVRFEFSNWDLLPEHQIRDRLAYLFRCPEILNPPVEEDLIDGE